jgi:hypothetical protein
MADDHPAQAPDSGAYHTVEHDEVGSLGDRLEDAMQDMAEELRTIPVASTIFANKYSPAQRLALSDRQPSSLSLGRSLCSKKSMNFSWSGPIPISTTWS